MTSDREFDAMAAELQADLDARRLRRLFAQGKGPQDVAAAYRLQRALRRVREARDESVVGFKIGFTSPAVRKHAHTLMGLDESVHGYLWSTEIYTHGCTVDHHRLGIEGELAVRLIDCRPDEVGDWVVDYEPIIELHMMGRTSNQMWDGPASDDQGRRGLELIGTNCVHTGVVHCDTLCRARVADIPLDRAMCVSIAGQEVEQVTLTQLQIDDQYGPQATIDWLRRTLNAEGNGEADLLRPGATLLCSTPGGLYPVPAGASVRVDFAAQSTMCYADT